MARRAFLFLALFTLVAAYAYAQGSGEQLTITTYYPSPYGSYNELQANRFSVGDANNSSALPTTNGTVAFLPRKGGDPAGWTDGKKGDLAYSNFRNRFVYHDGTGWKDLGSVAGKWGFGGIYEKGESGALDCGEGNPAAGGTCACPAGYTDFALAPSNECGGKWDEYHFCYKVN